MKICDNDGNLSCPQCGANSGESAGSEPSGPGSAASRESFSKACEEGQAQAERLSSIKRSYFWFKLYCCSAALCALAVFFAVCGFWPLGRRILFGVLGCLVGGALLFWADKRHKELTGISILRDDKAEGIQSTYFKIFGKKGLKVWSGIAIAFAIICFLLCLTLSDSGFLEALRIGLCVFWACELAVMVVWTFKLPGLLICIAAAALLGVFGDLENKPASGGGSSGASYSESDPGSPVEVVGAYIISESDPLFVVRYKWTNLTGQVNSANWNVGVHAYQNGMELKESYFYDIENDKVTRDIKNGVTVELEQAFYLDDLSSDVEVTFGPAITFDDEVWFTEVYKLK